MMGPRAPVQQHDARLGALPVRSSSALLFFSSLDHASLISILALLGAWATLSKLKSITLIEHSWYNRVQSFKFSDLTSNSTLLIWALCTQLYTAQSRQCILITLDGQILFCSMASFWMYVYSFVAATNFNPIKLNDPKLVF